MLSPVGRSVGRGTPYSPKGCSGSLFYALPMFVLAFIDCTLPARRRSPLRRATNIADTDLLQHLEYRLNARVLPRIPHPCRNAVYRGAEQAEKLLAFNCRFARVPVFFDESDLNKTDGIKIRIAQQKRLAQGEITFQQDFAPFDFEYRGLRPSVFILYLFEDILRSCIAIRACEIKTPDSHIRLLQDHLHIVHQ